MKFKDKYRIESTRISEFDYSQPGSYFITICTKNREHLFGQIDNGQNLLNEIGIISKNIWNEIPNHFQNVILDEFIVMPNHLHGIINIIDYIQKPVETLHATSLQSTISPKRGSISTIIRSYKSTVSKICHEKSYQFSWQSRFYEHVIRNEFELNKIRHYILNNPLNWQEDEENI